MAFPDVVGAAITYLTPELDLPVTTRVPDTRPVEWLQVRRVGGTALAPVRDQVRLDVIAWAADDRRAMELALEARTLLWRTAGTTLLGVQCYQAEEFMGPRLQDDPQYGSPTAWLTLELTTRADDVIHIAP